MISGGGGRERWRGRVGDDEMQGVLDDVKGALSYIVSGMMNAMRQLLVATVGSSFDRGFEESD